MQIKSIFKFKPHSPFFEIFLGFCSRFCPVIIFWIQAKFFPGKLCFKNICPWNFISNFFDNLISGRSYYIESLFNIIFCIEKSWNDFCNFLFRFSDLTCNSRKRNICKSFNCRLNFISLRAWLFKAIIISKIILIHNILVCQCLNGLESCPALLFQFLCSGIIFFFCKIAVWT